jgi:hypothetical protein
MSNEPQKYILEKIGDTVCIIVVGFVPLKKFGGLHQNGSEST